MVAPYLPSFKLSEIFESVQGEGISAGTPCVFLRLALCNLHCRWCDTKYTWDFNEHSYAQEVTNLRVAAAAERVLQSRTRRLVITGGEPLLQQSAIAVLLAMLPADWWVEIETNGTLEPGPELRTRVDQWNVSPKLASAGRPLKKRIAPNVLEAFRDTGRAWLKLVMASEADFEEADQLLADTGWPRDRLLFMACAATRQQLAERSPLVRREAERRGARYSPRLHVERHNGARGV